MGMGRYTHDQGVAVMSTESEMRAILQELHEKFNMRVYGASSYIKRDMRDRIEAVLAAAPQAPSGQQAEPMPQLSFQPSIGDQLALQEWYARALAGQQAERPEGPIEPTSANLQRWKSNPVFILGYDAGLHDRKLEQQSEQIGRAHV